MADLTEAQVVLEALQFAGHSAPSAAHLTLAATWFDNIRSDIRLYANQSRLFESTTFIEIESHQQRYSLPINVDTIVSMTILNGRETEVDVGATATNLPTITSIPALNAPHVRGQEAVVSTAPLQIVTFNDATPDNTVIETMNPIPTLSTDVLIVDNYIDLYKTLRSSAIWRQDQNRKLVSTPYTYHIFKDQLNIIPTPDVPSILQIDFMANVAEISRTSATWLRLLHEWKSLFVQGILVNEFRRSDDERYDGEYTRYLTMLKGVSMQEATLVECQYVDI